jgi:hypothetical protein
MTHNGPPIAKGIEFFPYFNFSIAEGIDRLRFKLPQRPIERHSDYIRLNYIVIKNATRYKDLIGRGALHWYLYISLPTKNMKPQCRMSEKSLDFYRKTCPNRKREPND